MSTPWWYGATIYHAYVRSFKDSDGDGHGDLGGLIEKADYLAELGITALWLSPIMDSPDHDWGYDVSDYYTLHPDLGTLADFDRLVATCAARGIRILIDLIANHTSAAHPWFVEASSSPSSPKRDFYVWADPKPDGTQPNNWVDDTGESAWTWDETAGQYYMHNFLATQPDLNWWNPDVHREFDRILDFWLDRGAAGFRIDVANGLYHDRELRDNPRNPRAYIWDTEVQGRYGLEHVHNFNQPQVHDVYRAWRVKAEERASPALLMGETWVARPDELAPYYGAGDELQLALNFPLIFAPFEAPALARVVAESIAAFPPGSCTVWAGSNHDLPRLASRWAGGDAVKARLAQTLLAMLPGTFVLYYGDELGMTDTEVPDHLHRDPLTAGRLNGQWPRDNARAAIRWDASESGGFSTGTPWLPLHGDITQNVSAQHADPTSMLALMRRLIRLRRAFFADPAVAYREIAVDTTGWVFDTGPLRVNANFSDHAVPLHAPGMPLVSSRDAEPRGDDVLQPWEAVVTRAETVFRQ